MIRHLHYTQLQEAAPQYPLIQLVDWTQVQTSTSNSFGAVEVIDMVTVAPHSWFNMQLNIFLYKYDDIPEELVMTHHLNDEGPAQREILARQKVMRRGPHNHMFSEHFYFRSVDYKCKQHNVRFVRKMN